VPGTARFLASSTSTQSSSVSPTTSSTSTANQCAPLPPPRQPGALPPGAALPPGKTGQRRRPRPRPHGPLPPRGRLRRRGPPGSHDGAVRISWPRSSVARILTSRRRNATQLSTILSSPVRPLATTIRHSARRAQTSWMACPHAKLVFPNSEIPRRLPVDSPNSNRISTGVPPISHHEKQTLAGFDGWPVASGPLPSL